MFLAGVNIGGFLSQTNDVSESHLNTFITKSDFEQISHWGFNVIRFPVDYNFFETENGNLIESRLKIIDNVISWSKELKIKIILELHKAYGHSFDVNESIIQEFWKSDSQHRKRFLKTWDMLSKRYCHFNNVIYEPLNEPVANKSDDWHKLVTDFIATVRKNSNQFLLIESNLWGNVNKFEELPKFDDDKIIYSFHYYLPLSITHQKAYWLPYFVKYYNQNNDYPGRPKKIDEFLIKIKNEDKNFYEMISEENKEWNKQALLETLKPVLKFKKKFNVPVLCGEFGSIVLANPQTRQNWLKDLIEIFIENDISYTYWNYKNMDFGLIDFTEQYKGNPNYDPQTRIDYASIKILQQGVKNKSN